MPFLGLNFGGATNIVDPDDAAEKSHVAYGGTVSWLRDGVLGFEVDFGYSPGFFERGVEPPLVASSSVTTLMVNVVVAAPRRWTGYSLRPYASGGFGAMRVRIEDVLDLLPVKTTLPAVDVGGGVLGFFTDRVGVRWDLRYFRGAKTEEGVSFGSTKLTVWRMSIAMVVRY